MRYYTREGARSAQGTINLCKGTDIIVEERYPKPWCFTVLTPSKKFILQAANEEEMAEWLEAIQNNLEVCIDTVSPPNPLASLETINSDAEE